MWDPRKLVRAGLDGDGSVPGDGPAWRAPRASGGGRCQPVRDGLVDGFALQGSATVRAPLQVPQGAPEHVIEPDRGVEPTRPRARLQGVPEGIDEGRVEGARIRRARIPAGGSLGLLAETVGLASGTGGNGGGMGHGGRGDHHGLPILRPSLARHHGPRTTTPAAGAPRRARVAVDDVAHLDQQPDGSAYLDPS